MIFNITILMKRVNPILVGVILVLMSAQTSAQEDLSTEDEITVVTTASRSARSLQDETTSVEIIDRATIDATGGNTVADLLVTEAGLELERSLGRSGVLMQGLDPEYALILIDGRRAIGRVNGTIDLNAIRLENVERIEIVKGPQSALYGADALAGVINIITKSPKSTELSAQATGGSRARLDLGAQGAVNQDWFSSRVSADFGQSNGDRWIPELMIAKAAQRTEFKGTNQDWMIHSSYQVRDSKRVDTLETGAILDRTNRTEDVAAGLAPSFKLSQDITLNAGADYSYMRDQFANDQRSSDALDQVEITTENLAEARANLDIFLGAHRLVVGMDFMHQTLSSPRLDADGSRQRVAVFAQDEWYVSTEPLVSIMPGVRAEFDSQYGPQVTPKIAARWDIFEELVARTSVGMGYRAPDFRELLLLFDNRAVGYVIRGNPDLEPESSWGANAGLEWAPNRTFSISTSFYRNEITNMIGFETTSEMPLEFSYINIAEAWSMGLETRLNLRQSDWRAWVTMVFEDTEDRALGLPLEGRSLFRGSAGAQVDLTSSTRLDVRGRVTGRRAFYVAQEDGSTTLDLDDPWVFGALRIDQELWAGFSLNAGVNNVFDAGSADRLPIEPRSFYAGVEGQW